MYTLWSIVKITCEQSIAPHIRQVAGVTESSSTWKRGHAKFDDFDKTSLQKKRKKLREQTFSRYNNHFLSKTRAVTR